jgi:shikimate dehydrogenase
MNIKGSTNIVGLIGHPVEHSFSPPMHNAAFKALNMDWAYVAFDVNPLNLNSAINGARSLGIKGFNVTIPHKIEVMKYLDEIDEVAGLIGAVNTIDFKNMKGLDCYYFCGDSLEENLGVELAGGKTIKEVLDAFINGEDKGYLEV